MPSINFYQFFQTLQYDEYLIIKKLKMSKNKSVLPSDYLYQSEDRSENQINLSTRIARIITEINLKRIRQYQSTKGTLEFDSDLFHFICFQGIPPLQGQFQNLDLPGEKTILATQGMKSVKSQEEYMKIFQMASFDLEAEKIRNIVESVNSKKKIILVYHSFGTYASLSYLKKYKNDHRLSGLMDLGGAPIRFYPVVVDIMSKSYQANQQVLVENKQIIYKNYIDSMKNQEVNAIGNQYQLMIFLKLVKDDIWKTMFQQNRNLPSFLKLFISGSNDTLFLEDLLSEKIVHYSYVNKLPEELHQKYQTGYQQLYGEKTQNIQERFCFNMPRGKHSLHMQRRTVPDIKLAIRQYLKVLTYGFT